jgi:hypothetical protein
MRRIFQISVSLLLLSADLFAQNSKDSYSSSSILSQGLWFKIAVTSDGIYRIDYSKLKQLGLENPSNPRIFGNNTGQLSYYNDAHLQEVMAYLTMEIICCSLQKEREGGIITRQQELMIICITIILILLFIS